ncbi:uncharacterized mitochondrial protein-like protein [Tanacetum coccineum]
MAKDTTYLSESEELYGWTDPRRRLPVTKENRMRGNVPIQRTGKYGDFDGYTSNDCNYTGILSRRFFLVESDLITGRSSQTTEDQAKMEMETPHDIIFGSTNKELCTGFEKLMKDKFQMSSMGELTFFLGLQVQQKEDGIFISQDKYVAEILKKFNYSDVKSASTPVDVEKPLVKGGDADDVDVHLYRSMIGSLMYFTSSRPDIMFAVCACARFQVSPKTSHLLAVKRIFRYLKGKPTLGLWYSRDSPFELVAYTDSDYAGLTQDRKSTTGGYLLTKGFDAGRFQYLVSSSGPRCQDTILGDVNTQTRLKLVLPVFVSAVKRMLMLPVQVSAVEVNPVIYTSCIEQFWATAKVQTVNGVRQLQALVDKKKVIITESSIRRDLHLDDAEGTGCLLTASIFEELARMGYEKPSQKLTFYKAFFSLQWKYFIHTINQCLSAKSTAWNEFSSSMASLIICLATNQKFNLSKYIFDAIVKHLDGGVKFLMYPCFLQLLEKWVRIQIIKLIPLKHPLLINHLHLPNPRRNNHRRRLRDIDLQKAKDAQAQEIAALKKRIQRLERKKMSRPTGLKRLRKVGMTRRVESSEDQESLGAPEDASKQGRSIEDIDADVDVSLVDETQERQGDDLMFDTGVLEDDEMHVEAKVDGKEEQSTKPDDSTAGEAVTTASVEVSVVPTTIEEITLAQTLIQIKAAKPKVVTTAATTTTTTRPKDRGVVVQEPSEFRVPQETQPSSSNDKGKGIMIEPEVPLKRKDQIALDEQIARDIQAKLDAELIEEQKLARKQEEEANIALIESWENTQAMMEADRLLDERLQSKEREELTDEEKAKLFMELMEKRRKHFAALRAQEKRNRPPTKAQKRTQMSTYLKHMGGYTYKQLKGKSFDEIQKLFDKEMKRVNTFVAIGSRKKTFRRKRAEKEQQHESSKKQKVEEEKESNTIDEYDEAELKKLLVIKKDEDIAIDAIPLATKLLVIIDYKLHKEGLMVHYQLIRADGSSKRYSSMIRMLQGIDREDLETLWRIVKAKYGDTRPDNEFERVLLGDLKVVFEPDIKSYIWRMLQGYRVTIWKLIDSSGVHFVRRNLKIQKKNIKFRGGLLGLKRLHGFLEVTAAQSFALRNFDLEDMELESINSGPTANLPILKLGEYEMWVIRIKQYFQIQDYALWEVIENGNSWVSVPHTSQENGITVTKMSTPATAESYVTVYNVMVTNGLQVDNPIIYKVTTVQEVKVVVVSVAVVVTATDGGSGGEDGGVGGITEWDEVMAEGGGGRRRDDGVNGDGDDGVAAAEVANEEAADLAGMVGIWPEVGRK